MKLTVDGLVKSFEQKEILHGVSFEAVSGRTMGFLGRNGSGKTTTIRCIMGLFYPEKGEVLLNGTEFIPERYRVGYLPEERGMYLKEPIDAQLVYFAELKGMKTAEAKKSVKAWLERFGLEEHMKKKLETLSKGNQQKIQIIQALVDDPEILILDEPFSGLDPVNAQLLSDTISEFVKKDRILIFSSHQMGFVEEFCEDITLIDQGNIILKGNLAEIKRERGKNRIRLETVPEKRENLERILTKTVQVGVVRDEQSFILDGVDAIKKAEILTLCLNADIPIEMLRSYEPSLQEIFISETVGEAHE